MATRRGFIATLAAALTVPRLSWADAGDPAFLAAARQGEDFVLYGLGADGAARFHVPLPARGHAAAAHPTRPEAVAFARRPGTFALFIDCARGGIAHRLSPPEGRQFNGHGAFSADGARLYTSEVVAETSEGRLGIWDAAGNYARITDLPTGGIGPHELRRLPDGGLVVANGGIQTDPADRTKLNLATMRPNLAYLSPEGALDEVVELAPEYRQLSIRHLALGPDGATAFAMQWEGDPAEPVPLLGLHKRGAAARLCPPDEAEAWAMKGYAGSIAWAGARIALTSPPGGVVHVFDAQGGFERAIRRADVSGVAPLGDGLMVTDGTGAVSRIDGDGDGLAPLQRFDLAWDNHLVAL
ncbi:DUF1513 domain-containing protein [Paracoccus sp. (in: a-proteobacteria)]|uniref:DUF1513 domain-containing protein n=1 Tax=Paracoccus sp. TaxID=267 RepID=UPI0035B2E2A7